MTKVFVGETFDDAVAPMGQPSPFGVEVKNGYPLESGQKGTPGLLDEVTFASIEGSPGMDDQAPAQLDQFCGPGAQALKGIFGRK